MTAAALAPAVHGVPDDYLRLLNLGLTIFVVILMAARFAGRVRRDSPERYSGPEAVARLGFILTLLAQAYATLEILLGWSRAYRLLGLTVALIFLFGAYTRMTYDEWRVKHPRQRRP